MTILFQCDPTVIREAIKPLIDDSTSSVHLGIVFAVLALMIFLPSVPEIAREIEKRLGAKGK